MERISEASRPDVHIQVRTRSSGLAESWTSSEPESSALPFAACAAKKAFCFPRLARMSLMPMQVWRQPALKATPMTLYWMKSSAMELHTMIMTPGHRSQ